MFRERNISVFILLSALYLMTVSVSAQDSAASSVNLWSACNPFEHKAFIENKGQFSLQGIADKDQIEYGFWNSGLQVFFTKEGIIYRKIEVIRHEEEEEEENPENERKEAPKHIPHYLIMKWHNANPEVKISVQNKASYYFCFPNTADDTKRSGIQAPAYKKLVYHDLYPGIDVEYTFPEDETGIKYALIIHPGADPSAIKMVFENAEVKKNKNGAIVIENSIGKLFDKAPETFYQDGKAIISSSFEVEDNKVTFRLGAYDHSETIVIDPLTVSTSFTGYNSAYDIEYDKQGSVYVYGGSYPFEEIKYSSAGVKQWVYITTQFGPWLYYGDFTVDPNSGSSYIFECWNYAAQAVKLSSSGNQTAYFAGDVNLEEVYRVLLNPCTHKLIIAGGAYGTNTAIMDTTLASYSLVNVFSTSEVGHDMAMMAQDNSGSIFMATTHLPTYGLDNVIIKAPAATLSPLAYTADDNMNFEEAGSIMYVGGTQTRAGFNGMAASGKYLYTYDGSLLQRWDKVNGTLINSKQLSAAPFTWGGLAVDGCDHIFAGSGASVVQLDTLFNIIATYTVTQHVYDIRIGNSKLYVCGKGYVTVFDVVLPACDFLSLTVNGTACSSVGFATAIANGGCLPYKYTWFPGGQTTPTATALPTGTYTVTVSDGACGTMMQTAAATVSISYQPIAHIAAPDTVCEGLQATLIGGGGGTYLWSTGESSSVITVAPAVTSTYSVFVVSPEGCIDTAEKTIAVTGWPDAVVDDNKIICSGSHVQLNASGGNMYLWSTGAITPSIVAAPEFTTMYAVSVSNGFCADEAAVTVTVIPSPEIEASASAETGVNAQLHASGGGMYHWFPEEGLSCSDCPSPFVSQYQTTEYCVSVTDGSGCTDTACVTVYLSSFYVPNAFTPNENGLNELFKPAVSGVYDYKLIIFNRWGELLFETNDTEEGWNGFYKGSLCEQDVYVYKLFFKDKETNKRHAQYGKVTLLK